MKDVVFPIAVYSNGHNHKSIFFQGGNSGRKGRFVYHPASAGILLHTFFGLLITGCFSLISCQDPVLMENTTPDSQATIPDAKRNEKVKNAKEWYEKKFPAGSDADATPEARAAHAPKSTNTIGEPEWSKTEVFKWGPNSQEFIRTPLKGYRVDAVWAKRMNAGGFRDLLLQKTNEVNYHPLIIEIHPDASYLQSKGFKGTDSTGEVMRRLIVNKDYTGYFLVYNIENRLIYGERRENGVVRALLTSKTTEK